MKVKQIVVLMAVLILLFIFIPASAQTEQFTNSDLGTTIGDELTSPPCAQPLQISLNDVIVLTLQKNLNIKIVDIDKRIAWHKIGAAYGIFDPLLRLSYERSEAEEESIKGRFAGLPVAFPEVLHETQKLFIVSLSQLLPTGAIVQLAYNMLRYQSNDPFTFSINPYYRSQATLIGKQPLLKNAGVFVTTSGIRIAKVNRQIVDEKFRQTVINTLSQALKTYWELVFAIENYEVQKISLQQAEDLLRITQIKYEAGVLPATDVLQAKAQVAARKDQLLLAAKIIRDIGDTLKKIMNIPRTSTEWQLEVKPQDKLSFQQQQIEEEASLAEALLYRPDYQQLKGQKKIAEIQKRVAKNQRLPELNIFGTYGFSAIDEHIHETHEELGTLDYNRWSAGAEFIFPLLNRRARHEYQQAKLLVDQLAIGINDLEQFIHLDVRNAVRKVQTSWERIGITQTGVEFEQGKLEDELKRFEVGMATSHDVLEFQRDLAAARARHLRAITDYLQALIELKTATGTLLQELNIQLQPSAKP